MKRIVFVALLLVAPCAANAQAARTGQTEFAGALAQNLSAKIGEADALNARVAELQKQVADLQKQLDAGKSPPAAELK